MVRMRKWLVLGSVVVTNFFSPFMSHIVELEEDIRADAARPNQFPSSLFKEFRARRPLVPSIYDLNPKGPRVATISAAARKITA